MTYTYLKKIILILCASFALLGVQTSMANEPPVVPLNKIVAVVNDHEITSYDLDEQFRFVKRQLLAKGTPLPPNNTLKKQVLDNMINTQVQVQLAERTGIRISNEQINEAIAKLATENHVSVETLYKQAKEDGKSSEAFRQEIKNELMVHELVGRDVASKIKVTPSEVAAYKKAEETKANQNQEYHVKDILIALPDTPSPEEVNAAEAKANAVMEKIKNGASFDEAAIADSNGSEALKGGDLGWRTHGELPTVFADKVANMKVGQVIGPIHTPNGFHILKLADKRQSKDFKPLTDAEIHQIIFKRKLFQEMESWLAQIKAQAYIKTYH